MYRSFDAFEFVQYLWRRWLVVAIACAAAFVVTLAVSLLLPKRYTATATIVIEPPGATDSRSAIVVSPMYLESLKTYERFATSDSLFERAVSKFHLEDAAGGHRPIESLKHSVLKVTKIRDTKILEISATLNDPRRAQNVAEYIARETVALNASENANSDRDLMVNVEQQAAAARQRLKQAEQAWTALSAKEPVESLQAQLDALIDSQGKIRENMIETEANVAQYQAGQGKSSPPAWKENLDGSLARQALLEKKLHEADRAVQELTATISRRNGKRDALQSELSSAQTSSDLAEKRLSELLATAGGRSERLRVMDPGIVPQRPSSPNVPLNVAAALLIAFTASIVYVSVGFVMRSTEVGFEPAVRGLHR